MERFFMSMNLLVHVRRCCGALDGAVDTGAGDIVRDAVVEMLALTLREPQEPSFIVTSP
jgi:hypothetical protein